ncbi:hypothetical protein NIES39_Q02730 [Arthrospira platensis NIES-39]|uniref:hypothetical protein n=1 Tax=Limnospira platensis TaxID=118562 RepID=UPI0001D0EF2E|nr:hypothetical protein NIES39_Q02730 [Arthrospira platensis NIES-39]
MIFTVFKLTVFYCDIIRLIMVLLKRQLWCDRTIIPSVFADQHGWLSLPQPDSIKV